MKMDGGVDAVRVVPIRNSNGFDIDDIVYTIPAESREHSITSENREHSITQESREYTVT